jgi:hypothetical protein
MQRYLVRNHDSRNREGKSWIGYRETAIGGLRCSRYKQIPIAIRNRLGAVRETNDGRVGAGSGLGGG